MSKKDCLRCGKSWDAEVESPVKCRHCKSPYWNTPRRYQLKDREQPTISRKSRTLASGAVRLHGVTEQELLAALADFEPDFLYAAPEIRALRALVRAHFARKKDAE